MASTEVGDRSGTSCADSFLYFFADLHTPPFVLLPWIPRTVFLILQSLVVVSLEDISLSRHFLNLSISRKGYFYYFLN